MPIFNQSVSGDLYEWLLKEQKRRKARTVQDVIREILREAKARAAICESGEQIVGYTKQP